MIIDAHAHILNHDLGTTKAGLLRSMKAAGISKSLVIDDVFTKNTGYTHQEMIKLVSGEPKLALAGTFDVMRGTKKDLVFVEKNIADGTYKAIKLYPGYQHFYAWEKRCHKVYALCMRYKIPVIFHQGDVWDPKNKALLKFSHPQHLDELAVKFPKLTIVMAHLGCPHFDHAKPIIEKNPNVYADISGLFIGKFDPKLAEHYRRELNYVIHYSGHEKLMFGSDFELTSQKDYVKFVKSLDLKGGKLADVLGRTAKKVYKI
ncbi:amidohydrolase family protein [Candidatus Woesearchaeota archaeon]|nr:amidohydrolase family protein [Candidatus Woesearchaeota archaeon]